jgi:carbamate kinase
VIANGGGGIPVVRDDVRGLRGVEAVIDKDLGAALLAQSLAVDQLVIATDVDNAVIGFGGPHPRPVEAVNVTAMRAWAADGEFATGSMGPKVDAVCRFVEATGQPGMITSLPGILSAVRGVSGTRVLPDPTT